MSIIAKKGGDFTPIPEGTHIAICYKMIHIGTIVENYMGEPKTQNKVQLTFELPFELKVFKEGDKEKPCVVSKEYTLSMHDKSNLRKDLEAWRGKKFTDSEAEEFDVTKLIGKACQITVVHNKKGYATVTGITGLSKGTSAPLQTNENFELSYENFDWDKFNALPDFIKNKMASSKEYKAMNDQEEEYHNKTLEVNARGIGADDDLPF